MLIAALDSQVASGSEVSLCREDLLATVAARKEHAATDDHAPDEDAVFEPHG